MRPIVKSQKVVYPVEQAVGVTSVDVEEGDIVIGIGSGQYTFLTRN